MEEEAVVVEDEVFTQEEQEALKATRDAFRDVYGTAEVSTFEEGEALLASARQQLQEALDMLPPGETRAAYDQAMKQCPHLVELESNPHRFLMACRYDPWATAKRIAVYWNKRLEIFGAERAFLPMTLSGEGALSPLAVKAFLQCAGSVVLPCDAKNRPIFYTERSRLCPQCVHAETRLQVMFYILQTLSESDEALKNGFLVATTMDTAAPGANESSSNSTNKKKDGNSNQQQQQTEGTNTPRAAVVRLFESGAIIAPVKAVHIIVIQKRSFMQHSVPVWLKMLERWKFLSLRTVVHFAESKEQVMSDLQHYHMEPKGIPTTLGGTLDLDDNFQEWIKKRREIEHARFPPPCPARLKAKRPRRGEQGDTTVSQLIHGNSCRSSSCFGGDCSGSDVADESRIPPDSPSSDPGTTSSGAAALHDLAAAASQAQADQAKDRKRKLDAIYQRKKRQQRKVDFNKLTHELETLQKENDRLKHEQGYLQTLWERALIVMEQQPAAAGVAGNSVPLGTTTLQDKPPDQHHQQPQDPQPPVQPQPSPSCPSGKSQATDSLDRALVEQHLSSLRTGDFVTSLRAGPTAAANSRHLLQQKQQQRQEVEPNRLLQQLQLQRHLQQQQQQQQQQQHGMEESTVRRLIVEASANEQQSNNTNNVALLQQALMEEERAKVAAAQQLRMNDDAASVNRQVLGEQALHTALRQQQQQQQQQQQDLQPQPAAVANLLRAVKNEAALQSLLQAQQQQRQNSALLQQSTKIGANPAVAAALLARQEQEQQQLQQQQHLQEDLAHARTVATLANVAAAAVAARATTGTAAANHSMTRPSLPMSNSLLLAQQQQQQRQRHPFSSSTSLTGGDGTPINTRQTGASSDSAIGGSNAQQNLLRNLFGLDAGSMP